MNEFKGAPGPWKAHGDSQAHSDTDFSIETGAFEVIAYVVSEADAALISAAPDLLACCKDFLRLTGQEANSLPLGFGAALLERVKSAVDKATSISN
jgi:hypothetical protein